MSDGRGPAGEPAMPGPEHDAWLREALRHAPDAGAAPPPTLRAAILAEARAAARTATRASRATPSLLGRALEFWSWLARPQVAAGFASVMAATLVGMLWWDRPIDETMLPPPASPPLVAPPVTQNEAPSVARSGTPPAAGSDRLQEAPPPAAAEPGPRDAAPAPSKAVRPRAAEAAKAAAHGEAAKAESKDDPRVEAPKPFPARTPVEADAAPRRAEPRAARPTSPQVTPSPPPHPLSGTPSTAAAPPPPPPATATAPPPAPAPAPRPDAFAAAKRAESGEKESSLAKSRSTAPAAPAAPAPQAALPPPQASADALGGAAVDSTEASAGGRTGAPDGAPRSPARQQPPAAGPSARPMAPLLAALASDGRRWSRRLTGGESAAVDTLLRDWLAEVQAAAPRWDAAAERSRDLQDRPASTASPATLRLDRDGRPGAIVQIEDGGVRFDPLTGSAWFAPLPPEVVARLRATLPPAPR